MNENRERSGSQPVLMFREAEISSEEAFFEDLQLHVLKEKTDEAAGTDTGFAFSSPAVTPEEIRSRQDIFRDLEAENVRCVLAPLIRQLTALSDEEAERAETEEERILLRFKVRVSCGELVQQLSDFLDQAGFKSSRLLELADRVRDLKKSSRFSEFCLEGQKLEEERRALRYRVSVCHGTVSVREEKESAGPGLPERIREVYRDFTEEEEECRIFRQPEKTGPDRLMKGILCELKKIYSPFFQQLADFSDTYRDFFPEFLRTASKELGFFLAVTEVLSPLTSRIPFCYPQPVQGEREENLISEGRNLILSLKLAESGKTAVPSDFRFSRGSSLAVVTGPNQGGKTTFARMIGQMYYLMRLGMPVPAREAKLSVIRFIYTHFERREREKSEAGKLQEDIRRTKEMTDRLTSSDLLIANELFSSASSAEAAPMAHRIIDLVTEKKARILYITFLEAVADRPDAETYVSQVDPEHPSVRLFRICRMKSDHRAYTRTLVQEYGISREDIVRRVGHEI